jgi:hypothetical protein
METLAGLVRCRRCGRRKLTVRYTGARLSIPRYSCWRGLLDNGELGCIAYGGLRVDDALKKPSERPSAAIVRQPAIPPIGPSG